MIVALIIAFIWAIGATATALMAHRKCQRLDEELSSTRQFIELANDPILVADLVEGRIIHCNLAACQLLGYDPGALLNRTLPSIHPEEMLEESARVIADVWEKRGLIYRDLPFVHKDGTRIPVEVSARVFEFERQPAMLIFARDIRKRLELEAQLVQSEKMAALGQLVAGVAHEINTPVGAINANVAVVRKAVSLISRSIDDSILNENRKLARGISILEETVETTKLASDRIITIVASLRNFARLDEAERKEVDVHEGVESTLTLLRHELKHGVDVVKEYGELPKVICFPNQLNQVFMNILLNGIQAMDGKGTLTIRTSLEDEQACISFTDSGKGISADHLQHLFDPGFTTKGVGVGTGLGLSISYQIIEKHNGKIEVHSEPGEGATFTVRIPV